MSGLIDPRTGMPTTPQYSISNEDLIKVLTSQRVKIDLLNQQNMQLGLYVEFIVEHLLALQDADGNPLIEINVDGFQEFAERRYREIQAEVAAQQAKVEAEAAQSVLNSIPDALGSEIQLNE